MVAAAEQTTLKAAEAAAFRSALTALDKLVGKASIVGFLVGLGIDAENTSCETGNLYGVAKPAFASVADVLGQIARAAPGKHPFLTADLDIVRTRLDRLKKYVMDDMPSSECAAGHKVALHVIMTFGPTLDAARAHLKALAKPSKKPSKPSKPKKARCMTAIKLLTEYESLFKRVNKGKTLDPKRVQELNTKRDNGTITFDDLPGSLKPRFPGEFKGLTLKKIRELCK